MRQALERKAHTVLISSPDRSRYKQFLKLLGTTKLYMPIWSDVEIAVCRFVQPLKHAKNHLPHLCSPHCVREKLFPHLKVEAVTALQLKWGNIPRYVLEKVGLVSLIGLTPRTSSPAA